MALRPGVSAGFKAGLKYWLFFLLAFTVIGYGPFISICLGAIGGIAGGVVEAWLNPSNDYRPEKSSDSVTELTPEDATTSRIGPRLRLRSSRRMRRQTTAQRRFGWLFRRES